MEPLGTITMYYPFLGDEAKRVVEELVQDAMSYYDFVQSLMKAVNDYPMDSDFAWFSLIQALSYPDTWKMMQARLEENVQTKPLAFFRRDTYDTLANTQLEGLEAAMKQAISSNPDDWILVHLYMAATYMAPEPVRSHYLDSARAIIDRNQDLQRFMILIHFQEAYDLRMQGDVEGAIRAWDKVHEIADEYDDIFSVAAALVQKANALKDFDVHKALELYDEIYSMLLGRLTEFDATQIVAMMTAVCYEALGEYDLALSLLFKDFEIKSQISDDVQVTPALIVSRIYCTLEMPEQALEWLKAKAELHRLDESMLHSVAANALVLQGQLDDATRHLVAAHNGAMKSGDEQVLGDYLYAKGLYELADGDLNNAETTLEEALKLGDPHLQIQVNLGLLALTRCEILKGLDAPVSGSDKDYSGPWMKRLEKHATEKNYPGIQMQHALLKASYQTQIGEPEMARLTLENALTISDSPGVKTLRKKIEQKLEELDSIEQEQT
ncbi:MAG: tetratricopeptide repeat protein [Candidatus Thorarchaeota archaeon]